MNFIENENVKKVLNVATLAGASILALRTGQKILSARPFLSTSQIMPAVTVLVAVAAFTYALDEAKEA